jgi:uracil phosphoribosyltransferase
MSATQTLPPPRAAGDESRESKVVRVQHPLVLHHVTRLRDKVTPPEEFRLLLHRLAVLLAYEATKDLAVEPHLVQTPLTTAAGHRLRQRVGLVPILRAGLGMVDPVLNLIPSAEVWHLGLYRDEETALPIKYYSKLAPHRPVDVALVLDPMLATGGSAASALAELYDWGVRHAKVLSVIASRDGIREVTASYPDADVFVCAIDEDLNSQKFIVPGLGDAGDRIFNTSPQA